MMLYFFAVVTVLSLLLVVGLRVFATVQTKRVKVGDDELFTRKRELPAWMYTFWFNSYNTLYKVPFLRFYVERLKMQYELGNPGNERESKESAAKTAVIIWSVGLLLVAVAFWQEMGLYFLLCIIAAVFVMSAQLIYNASEKKEMALLRDFCKFLNDVQRQYIAHGMVDEAIFDVMEHTGRSMRIQAEIIYDTLAADDQEEALLKYNSSIHNKFFQQFLAICSTTLRYGDRKNEEGMSVFMLNLIALNKDVEEEILDRNLNRYNFSSLVEIALLPIFALEPLARWAIAQDATFTTIYNGTAGILLEVLIFVLMLFSYTKVVQLRDAVTKDKSDHFILRTIEKFPAVKQILATYAEKNYGKMNAMRSFLKKIGSALTAKQFIIQKFAFSVVAFIASVFVCIVIVITLRNASISDYRTVGGVTNAASEEDSIAMMMLTKRYVDNMIGDDWLGIYNEATGNHVFRYSKDVKGFIEEVVKKDLPDSQEAFDTKDVVEMTYQYNKVFGSSTQLDTKLLGTEGDGTVDESTQDGTRIMLTVERIIKIAEKPESMSDDGLFDSIASQVADRVASYRNAYFKWYYLVICYVIAAIAYFVPERMLKAKGKQMQIGMEDEVIQFMAVISVLRGIKKMSIETLLSWLERFSDIFSESIEKCNNNFPNDQLDSLYQLKSDESFAEFGYLVDGLIECDRIGIKNAFSSVDSDRKIFQEKRKQENMMRRNEAASKAKMIAYAPLYSVIYLYLVVPFLWKAFAGLATYMSQMSSI